MKIHGHSIIELRNVKTGEIERYEDDNMVTNALNYYFQDVGAWNINPIYDTNVRNNLIPQLLGGLLLFDTTITENADNVICPSGVKMIGNGAYNVSHGNEWDITEMGTYDQVESHWTNDGKCVMVWNFATTQANGTINCACLTSANHGFIGEGNSTSDKAIPNGEWQTRRTDFSIGGTPQSISMDGGSNEKYRLVRASRTNKTVTMIDEHNFFKTTGYEDEHMSVTGKIKLKTYFSPFRSVDMRWGAGFQYIPVSETEITIPPAFITALSNGNPQFYGKVGDTYYLVAGVSVMNIYTSASRINANASIHVLRINADNTVNYYTVANPKETALDFYNPSLIVADDTLILGEYGNAGTWFISLSQPADVTHIEDKTIGGVYDLVYPNQGVAYASGQKIDIGERKIYYINSIRNATDDGAGYSILSDNPLANKWYGNSVGLYKTTNYLATINNLAEPVTKTAEKTMKVTYVLSFDDGE